MIYKPVILAGAAGLFLMILLSSFVKAEEQNISIVSTRIENFDLKNKLRKKFGKLKFAGGLVLRSSALKFGALSGLRISNKDEFLAISDTGFWVRAQIIRNQQGNPVALQEGKIAPLLDGRGLPFNNKWLSDAEGLTRLGDDIFVSTEQNTRILRYRTGKGLFGASLTTIPLPSNRSLFHTNNGFEALASFPKAHHLSGKMLAFRERPGRNLDHHQGFIIGDRVLGQFSLMAREGFAVTDADFLPSGDLLVLERRFTMGRGAETRIRRINSEQIEVDAKLRGEIIFSANRNQQIDNMEGLSVFLGSHGKTRIGMVSDDNHWPLQRTLYLEFILDD